MIKKEPITKRGKLWEIKHSLWILLNFIGLGGIGFMLAGIRTKQLNWKIIGAIYFVLTWARMIIELINSSFAYSYYEFLTVIGICSFVVCLVHSIIIRKEFLMRLDAVTEHREIEIRNSIRNEYNVNYNSQVPQNIPPQFVQPQSGSVQQNPHVQAVHPPVKPKSQSQPQKTFDVPENNVNSVNSVDINNASAAELSKLPGVNIVAAKKALAYRTDKNGFSSNDEFYRVVGVDTKPHFIVQLQEKIICGTYIESEKNNERRTKLDFD